jgi:hypothetical protein
MPKRLDRNEGADALAWALAVVSFLLVILAMWDTWH